MSNMSLHTYLYKVDAALQQRDGATLASLVSFGDGHVNSSDLMRSDCEDEIEGMLPPPYDELITHHIKCVCSVSSGEWIDAIKSQNCVVQTFTKILSSQKDENWGLLIMYAICVDLRRFAVIADKEQRNSGKGKPHEHLERSAELILGCFRICAADNRSSETDTKRWGMLNLVNQLFKIYFPINKLHLCKPLIRAIESSPFKDSFLLGQQVTYRYYTGKQAMFDSNYKSADENLTYSFVHCHKNSKKNKRLILIYLIPVKMLLGFMPSQSLLEKYSLQQFSSIVRAVKQGNLLAFSSSLAEHEAFFVHCGIYLILEKLKIITYRNLFKKVFLLCGTHQLDLSLFLCVLRYLGEDDMDLEETQCIVANLIYEGRVKGYISLQHLKLVVSKQNPFPPLSQQI